jgi:succinyl-diaminopimelate desuccinylase
LLLTSDEEGDAIDGTARVVQHLQQQGIHIDYCVVGEPSSREVLGDMVRVGRRGSLNGRIRVAGIQGHVAYPEQTRNPIHLAAPVLRDLAAYHWDDGDDYFPATSFQISNIHAGTGATNVVPGSLELMCNFRFNSQQTPALLKSAVETIFARHAAPATFDWTLSGMPFLTERGRLVDAVCASIEAATGRTPELSTGGGTSDGRFIAPTGAQVVEVGVVNKCIHQVDEYVRSADITTLVEIYRRLLRALLTD